MEENKKPSNPYAFSFANDYEIQEGMTLRDYFAGKAMQAMISNQSEIERLKKHSPDTNKAISLIAYTMADKMLKQRELNQE